MLVVVEEPCRVALIRAREELALVYLAGAGGGRWDTLPVEAPPMCPRDR